MGPVSGEAAQKQWYERYRERAGKDRNDLRLNRGVLFQALACEMSVIRAANQIEHDPGKALVLDVGCGGGGDFFQLIRLKYDAAKITGIDIQAERIAAARSLYTQASFIHGDATRLDFADNTFDLAFESTMFATLPVDSERRAIASEMVRVCKPGGYLLLVDWKTPKPGDRNYKALTAKQLRVLFAVGSATRLVGVYRGALIPPVGRFLSKHASCMYFPVCALFPFLVGQVSYLLRKW